MESTEGVHGNQRRRDQSKERKGREGREGVSISLVVDLVRFPPSLVQERERTVYWCCEFSSRCGLSTD
jgi:hypothetical protein